MATGWSSVDPLRRQIFIGAVVIIVVLLGIVAFAGFGGGEEPDEPKASARAGQQQPAAQSPAAPGGDPTPLPTGIEHDDRQSVGPVPSGPQSLPPRYTAPPAAPMSEADLTAASGRAMSFLEVFANGRWNDTADKQIAAISPFVSKDSLDSVLARFQKVRPVTDRHEIVTYQVTEARWALIGETQVVLTVAGNRTVASDGVAPKPGRMGFTLTLVKQSNVWMVTAVRDPGEGDVGNGNR